MERDAQEQGEADLRNKFAACEVLLTANIVSAYVENNSVQPRNLAELIQSVRQTIGNLGKPTVSVVEPTKKQTPEQIRKSIDPGGIISILDGKPYNTLKRHLAGQGLNPLTHRERFGLPREYSMVLASYTAKHSAMAKTIGLAQPCNPASLKSASSSEITTEHERPPEGDVA